MEPDGFDDVRSEIIETWPPERPRRRVRKAPILLVTVVAALGIAGAASALSGGEEAAAPAKPAAVKTASQAESGAKASDHDGICDRKRRAEAAAFEASDL